MRCLLILLLTSLRCFGALTADAIIDWDQAARGTLDNTRLNASVFGNTGGWLDNSPYTFMSLVAGSNSYSFARPVTVGAITYTAAGTNWLYCDEANASSATLIDLAVAGGADSTVTNIAVCGFVVLALTNNTGSAVNLDLLLLFPPTGGQWSVLQAQPGINSGATKLVAHSDNGGSQFSAGTNITNVKVYFYVAYRDNPNTTWTISFYDPDNSWALSHRQTSSMASQNMYFVQWKVGYIGQIPGYVMWGRQLFLYAPSAQTLSDLVTPLGGGSTSPTNIATLGTAVINNGRLQ